METKTAKFEIKDILPIGLVLVVTGIGLAYGLDVINDISNDYVKDHTLTATCNSTLNGGTGSVFTGCGIQYNATKDAMTGIAKLPKKMPLIVNVIVAAIVIGILIRYLMVRYNQ